MTAGAVALACASFAITASVAGAAVPLASEGGPLTASCRSVDESLRGPCRAVEKVVEGVAATCRYAGAPESACALPLAPKVSRAAVERYRDSWVHRALVGQYELAGDVGFRNTPWVGTHNSFNSVAEMGPQLSASDSNQQLALTDQLDLDVRSLEIDAHLFPSVRGGGRPQPMVCHATGPHAGCTFEKTLREVLGEIDGWLDDHPRQVLLLYVEDHLDTKAGYDEGASVIDETLGDRLYRPPGDGERCVHLPYRLTRDDVRRTGNQVIVMSGCGTGSAWASIAFDGNRRQEGRPAGYGDFPGCDPNEALTREEYDSNVIRYFEDSTTLSAVAAPTGASSHDDGLTPATVAAMTRCGVDLFGFDQILPDDGRLEALVWSWREGEPSGDGRCAVQSADDGRWLAHACGKREPIACRTGRFSWKVVGAGPYSQGDRLCRSADAGFEPPRTGYDNVRLRRAADSARVGDVLLGLSTR